jgi:hypothetical protein
MNPTHKVEYLADEPDDAAYHLVAALGCCNPSIATDTNVNRIAEAEIMNLEHQKQSFE